MNAFPNPGESLHGFTLMQTGTIGMLGARTAEFIHTASGAQLLYIQNDDHELGFNIIFRTPQLDDADSCHILEHLILCSCKKYPSRDIFFDMDSSSFASFMNGITDNTYTCYPLCTRSQEQLIRLADVFLCCMEAPEGLENENFFLREGIRYELEGEKGPLTLQGTVFSEDWGHLTDILENADSNTARALYPGHTASHLLGRAHFHYKEVSFEQVKKVFSQFYSYSNCLVVLYGAMDYEKILDFLHREHFSKYPAGSDMAAGNGSEPRLSPVQAAAHRALALFGQPPAPGFREIYAQSPAYKDSPKDHASILDYAIDLSDVSQEDLLYWDLLADMLDSDISPLQQCAREEGLNNALEVYADLGARPSLRFRLHNGDSVQKDSFLRCIRNSLRIVSEEGLSEKLVCASLKEKRLSDCLTRESSHLGFHISEEIGHFWSVTGRTDYFLLYEKALAAFSEDRFQAIPRRLAARALSPRASAFCLTAPAPGMAEAMEKEKEMYLKEKLEAMPPGERADLAEQTRRFRVWSQEEKSCRDFLISPRELPEPEKEPAFTITQKNGITLYAAPAPAAGLGCYQLFFDLSGLAPEDWKYLSLYQLLLTELDTGHYSVEDQKALEQEYLHGCAFDELYPGKEAGGGSRPMMSVVWYGFSEDFDSSLGLLLDIMTGAHYEDRETIIRVLEKYLPDYDLARPESTSSLAYALAESWLRHSSLFRFHLNSPDIYYFLRDILDRLQKDPHWISVLAEKLREVAAAAVCRRNLIFLSAAEEDALPSIQEQALAHLSLLPEGREKAMAALPRISRRIGAVTDSPSLEIRLLGDFRSDADFKGRYLPFLLAAGDKYIKPGVRYQGEAYDSGVDIYLSGGYFTLWSTADSRADSTIPLLLSSGKSLETLDISPEDLAGYILSAYSQILPPSGVLGRPMAAMRRHLAGIRPENLQAIAADIPLADLSCQKEAGQAISRLIRQGALAAAGNEGCLLRAKNLFDEIWFIRRK